MQMQDLIKPIEQMTDEELMERLRTIRSRRTAERPAAKAHAKRAAKKGAVTRIKKVDDMFAGMSAEEKQQLIKLLGG